MTANETTSQSMKLQYLNNIVKKSLDVSINRVDCTAAAVDEPAAGRKNHPHIRGYPTPSAHGGASADAARTAVLLRRGPRAVASPSVAPWVAWLTGDGGGSDVVNFPFAFSVYLMFLIGLSAIVWSLFLVSVWLAIAGFLVTLVGTGFYG